MIIVALWWEKRRSPGFWSYVCLLGGSIVAFLIHLSSAVFVTLACLITVAYDHISCRYLGWRGAIRNWGHLICAAFPLVFYSLREPDKPSNPVYSSWKDKIIHVSQHASLCYDVIPALAVASFLLVLLVYYWRRKMVDCAQLGALLSVGFAAAYLVSPYEAFRVSAVDVRFLLPSIVFFVLSMNISIESPKVFFVSLLAAAAFVQMIANGMFMHQADKAIGDQVRILQQLPETSRVFVVYNISGDRIGQRLPHAPHYAALEKILFIPTLFAWRGQDPLVYRDKRFERISPWESLQSPRWAWVFSEFDYVFAYRVEAADEQFLAMRCLLIARSGENRLYRVLREPASPTAKAMPTSQPNRESQR
ncbi:MAG: hypothetical protein HPY54_04160 [Chthonomonadetes bacterium]|nr:hypothetical protein [Chthonomonadetes bacterium]